MKDEEFVFVKPDEIEKESFRIIGEELEEQGIELKKKQEPYIKRCIHTSAMALAGINKTALKRLGCEAHCFMADERIREMAHKEGITRAAASMQAASKLDGRKIFVIGNAPTALIELDRLHRDEGFDPDFIIGVPVGFVNVVYAKEQIIKSDIPYIVNRGRKGGSNIAACLVNAALYNVENRQL